MPLNFDEQVSYGQTFTIRVNFQRTRVFIQHLWFQHSTLKNDPCNTGTIFISHNCEEQTLSAFDKFYTNQQSGFKHFRIIYHFHNVKALSQQTCVEFRNHKALSLWRWSITCSLCISWISLRSLSLSLIVIYIIFLKRF